MATKNKDFDALGIELAEASPTPPTKPAPAEPAADPKKPGRPPVPTVQFTLRITRDLRKKLASISAKEQEAGDGRNVTPQQIAVRILEEHFKHG